MSSLSQSSKILSRILFPALMVLLVSCQYIDDLLPDTDKPKNTWTRKKDFPFQQSVIGNDVYYPEIQVTFGMGTKAYVVKEDSIYEYNPLQDKYTFKIKKNMGSTEGMVSFVIGDKAYLINSEGDLWQFNPKENIVIKKASFEGMKRYSAFGFAIKDKGYFGGGWVYEESDEPLDGYITKKDFWEYNPQTDKWIQKADLPEGTRRYANGVTIGTRGYLMIGVTSEFSINNEEDVFPTTVWEYIPLSNTWEKRRDFPGEGRMRAVSFSIADKAYVGLGERPYNLSNTMYFQDFYVYSSTNDSWERIAYFPGQGRIRPVGFSVLNKGYAGFGGLAGVGVGGIYDLWQYKP